MTEIFLIVSVLGCHDGDSCRIDVRYPSPFRAELTMRNVPARLCGLDAPEMGQPGALASRDALLSWIGAAQVIVGRFPLTREGQAKQDKYGRYLVTLIADGDNDLNARLIAAGHAVHYRGDC